MKYVGKENSIKVPFMSVYTIRLHNYRLLCALSLSLSLKFVTRKDKTKVIELTINSRLFDN